MTRTREAPLLPSPLTPSHKQANSKVILNMKMVSHLLFRLMDECLTIRTIKSICNVISTLLGIMPRSEDIQRSGVRG